MQLRDSMLLYLAGYSTDKEIFDVPEAENLLESYLLFKNKDYVKWHKDRNILDRRLFLDSGAFSAFTRGETIDIDKYCDFIKKYEHHIETYAGLDVIGDYQATRRNIEYMESRGLHPLPTFHHGSPYEELERMVEKYDYIALGGLVPIAMDRNKMKKHLDKCFSIIGTKVKVHGFGVNAFWAWERYPFYSADATSWLMGGKFRRAVHFDPKQRKIIQTTKTLNNNPSLYMKAHVANYQEINRNNAIEYAKAADFCTKLWASRGVKWD